MIRKILSVLVLAAGFAVAAPALSVDNITFDAGLVPENSKVEAVFRFTNTGTRPLKITNVRSGCGCTVVAYDTVIAPGRTGVIRPVVDLAGFRPGRSSRSVNVTTNASNMPAVTLVIAYNIVGPIDVSEDFLSFESAVNRTLYLSSAKRDLAINGIIFQPQGGSNAPGWAANIPLDLTYRFTPAPSGTREDGLSVYELEIEPPSVGDGQGPVAGEFRITTNHPGRREIVIHGQVR
ncbi:MAG: DUF1573 domain-containing protein [Chitinispirillales bacterium]|jgi:hypothetical protein|nr:DUF1573 domain-containing protein [Chitinispirillales bacterium]